MKPPNEWIIPHWLMEPMIGEILRRETRRFGSAYFGTIVFVWGRDDGAWVARFVYPNGAGVWVSGKEDWTWT